MHSFKTIFSFVRLSPWLLLAFGACFVCLGAQAGELVLTGVYKGKDPFVQNPYHADGHYCTQTVFVNDRPVLESPKASAFKVDLSYLPLKALVVIRIVYHDGCEPKIVNPHVLHDVVGFQFLFAKADEQSINWLAQGELPGGSYHLEQYLEGEWRVAKATKGRGHPTHNEYNLAPDHRPGTNRYRVKYTASNGEAYYSVEFDFEGEAELRPVTDGQ